MSESTTDTEGTTATQTPTTAEFADCITQLQEQVNTLETESECKNEQIAVLAERVNTLETEIECKDERIASLEEQVADQQARMEAATRKRHHLADEIERVETKTDATEPTEDAPADAADAEETEPSTDTEVPQTPLEQVVGLPEHLAEEELTANQERARFIAQDVRDYAERVPAGFAIPSTDLRKVLKAKDGSTPHTQTVARVMEFLDELGGEDVTLVKRRGTKRIAFSEEAVERLNTHASRARADETDREADGSITGVVMGGG